MASKRCTKCGYPFEGKGDLCSGCRNGHGSNRDDRGFLTKILDYFFGYDEDEEKDKKEDDE